MPERGGVERPKVPHEGVAVAGEGPQLHRLKHQRPAPVRLAKLVQVVHDHRGPLRSHLRLNDRRARPITQAYIYIYIYIHTHTHTHTHVAHMCMRAPGR